MIDQALIVWNLSAFARDIPTVKFLNASSTKCVLVAEAMRSWSPVDDGWVTATIPSGQVDTAKYRESLAFVPSIWIPDDPLECDFTILANVKPNKRPVFSK